MRVQYVCVCDSHLQELCGRQVDVGVYYLKAGAQVLGAHLYNRKTKNHMVQLNKLEFMKREDKGTC